ETIRVVSRPARSFGAWDRAVVGDIVDVISVLIPDGTGGDPVVEHVAKHANTSGDTCERKRSRVARGADAPVVADDDELGIPIGIDVGDDRTLDRGPAGVRSVPQQGSV